MICRNSLYILSTSSVSDVCVVNILCQSFTCVSFVHKVLGGAWKDGALYPNKSMTIKKNLSIGTFVVERIRMEKITGD